ncbi:MAG: hypothetical protein M1575_02890 [Patescibacteria group bacterium]|nr:hypothetical protein [Patescibacteria group bacterium]MCL5095651.1 hypothetical protein [Patescibacteria group bacterium]
MSPHFETVKGDNIMLFHNPISQDKEGARRRHADAQNYANEHQVEVVEVADGRGQPCAACKDISNRYQPQTQK